MKKILLSALALLPLLTNAQKVWDYEDFTVTKVSNPTHGEREADGLIAGGDRQNSYTWRLAGRGDEIYIATARNIGSVLVNLYGSQISAASGISMDAFWAMMDAVTNGDILRNDVSEGADIICYNRTTGEFKVVWTGDLSEFQRMAVTFGDNVYFGSYSANQSHEQYLLKLDKEGNFTKVYTTTGTTAMRANCVYDGHLFFASADARIVVPEGERQPIVKMAVIRKSNEDDTVWDLVADYKDFGDVPFDPIQSSWAGAPFWELASHNGYIYATAPGTAGFVVFRGRPAQDGEIANAYGWHWEEVVGLTGGMGNPGLSDVPGGEPGTMRSLIGSVYEFNGELYAYNFDHAFGGEALAFAGMMQQLTGKGVKASDYLGYMYNSLQNPQKVWKLNDATGKFEELTAFTELMEGTTNEYVWRMGEHNGKLYVATMDAGIFYNYLTQLTNGSFFKMSAEEKMTKLQYIGNAVKLLAMAKGNETADQLREKLEQLQALLSQYVEVSQADEETLEVIVDIQGLNQEIKAIVCNFLQEQSARQMAIVTDMLNKVVENMKNCSEAEKAAMAELMEHLKNGTLMEMLQTMATDICDRIDGKGIEMYRYINKTVMDNQWGFDLLRTSDGGQSFEVITRSGFDDKYNYGCPSFLSTEEGLYFGTCNPFYGGQLYLLSEKEVTPSGIGELKSQESTDGSDYHTLSGQVVKGVPTRPGIYLKDGRKVVVGL
jgi:hypothetical protein